MTERIPCRTEGCKATILPPEVYALEGGWELTPYGSANLTDRPNSTKSRRLMPLS